METGGSIIVKQRAFPISAEVMRRMLQSIRKGMGALKARLKYAPFVVLAVPELPTDFWDILMKLFAIIVAWLQQVLASLFG